MSARERSLVLIKPDGVQRALVGKIIARFEERGLKLIALKLIQPTVELLEKHYGAYKEKPFFPGLMKYMISSPIVAMVLEGFEVIKATRTMLGATNAVTAVPGSIRGDYALSVERNICHASDSVENAEAEIKLWFPEGVVQYTIISEPWLV